MSATSPIHIMRLPPLTPTPTQCLEPFVTLAWSFTTISNSISILFSGASESPLIFTTSPKSIEPRSWSFVSPTVDLRVAFTLLKSMPLLLTIFFPTLLTSSETNDMIEVPFTGRMTCNSERDSLSVAVENCDWWSVSWANNTLSLAFLKRKKMLTT